MRRLFVLALLVLPLTAFAQPDGRFSLTLSGGGYGPLDMEGEARFGGAVGAGLDVPAGTNVVLTFEGDDGGWAVFFTKDVIQPTNTQSNGHRTVRSGHDEDFAGLTLFEYGFRLQLPDGRELVSADREQFAGLTIGHVREGEYVTGSFSSVVVEPPGGGARASVQGRFEATPSGVPVPGLDRGAFVLTFTRDIQRMVTGGAIWTRLPRIEGFRPWLMTLQGASSGDQVILQRNLGWPTVNQVGYGEPISHSLQPPDRLLGLIQLEGETVGLFSSGMGPSRGARPSPIPPGPYNFNNTLPESGDEARGTFDFWSIQREYNGTGILKTVRVTGRYHAVEPGEATVAAGPPGGGWAGINQGGFNANVGGTQWSGPVQVSEFGQGFQFQLTGGAQGGSVGSITFSAASAALRTGSYRFHDPGAGPLPAGAVGGGATVQQGASGKPYAFTSGSLRIERLTDDMVSGSFNGIARYRDPRGGGDSITISGTFQARRGTGGGQVNLPPGVTLPPGVQLPQGVGN